MAGTNTTDTIKLDKVITSLRMLPGDVIELCGDAPNKVYSITINGTSPLPIILRSYSSTRKISGTLSLDGDYLTLQNLELCYDAWTTRVSQQTGSSPTDIPVGLDVTGLKVRVINCIIHDFSKIGLWSASQDAEWYGNVVYNVGWTAPDREHGHMLYIQNDAGPRKLVKHNIMIGSFGWGIHAYAKHGAQICDMDFVENIIACAGNLGSGAKPNILIGPEHESASGINLTGNCTYGGGGLNFYVGGAVDVTMVNNYIPSGVTGPYTAVEESGNYLGPTIGNAIRLFQNAYDSNRANLAIYNQAEAETIEVDVSAIYANDVQVQVRNVQDYYADIQTLTVTAGKIVVNMQAINRTVATPVQWTAPATTFTQFGAFVVEAV